MLHLGFFSGLQNPMMIQGNYDYIMDVKFREDGEINVETRFAGYPEFLGRQRGMVRWNLTTFWPFGGGHSFVGTSNICRISR